MTCLEIMESIYSLRNSADKFSHTTFFPNDDDDDDDYDGYDEVDDYDDVGDEVDGDDDDDDAYDDEDVDDTLPAISAMCMEPGGGNGEGEAWKASLLSTTSS